MKKIFYTGLAGIALFEFLKVYFIMPLPGSQRIDSIDIAYSLHNYRWSFRIFFGLMIAVGTISAFQIKHKWLPAAGLLVGLIVIYLFNFYMTAESMFRQPQNLTFKPQEENSVNDSSIVIGVEHNGVAKAYPIRFIVYHHQVQDTVGGQPILVTYCSVCRSGRVFEPTVKGKHEKFRLVGMDHFNAMFEDATTKSWWRQVTGEAITGKLKGAQMPEFFSTQTSLSKWLQLNPNSLIMQADSAFINQYDTSFNFENGKSISELTGTDSLSGKDKSWVIGVKAGKERKSFDWNQLKKERIIMDKIGDKPVMVVLAIDDKSFFAFERPGENSFFNLRNDTIFFDEKHYKINGQAIDTTVSLKPLPAYQEFLHSWNSFNNDTKKY